MHGKRAGPFVLFVLFHKLILPTATIFQYVNGETVVVDGIGLRAVVR